MAGAVPAAAFFAAGRLLEARDGQGLVVLEPETWAGKPLPVLEYILDPADRAELAGGRWTVVLFNRDCDVCREHLARLAREARATTPGAGAGRVRVRVMDVAPPETPANESVVPAELKQVPLRQYVQYIVEVPVEVTIADGIVQGVRKE